MHDRLVFIRVPHAHKYRLREWVRTSCGGDRTVHNGQGVVVFGVSADQASELVDALRTNASLRRVVNAWSVAVSEPAGTFEELIETLTRAYDDLGGGVVKLSVRGCDVKPRLLEALPARVALAPRGHDRVLVVERLRDSYLVGTTDRDLQTEEPVVVSRAYHKLFEAHQRWSLPIGAGSRVVDVGAAPGGWSQCCLDRGCDLVVAIDPAELLVPPCTRLMHVKRRVQDVAPNLAAIGGTFDACLCDANAHPRAALRALVPAVLPRLRRPGAVLVLTLKQPNCANKRAETSSSRRRTPCATSCVPRDGDDDEVIESDDIVSDLDALGFRDIRVAWLWSNARKERTLYAIL